MKLSQPLNGELPESVILISKQSELELTLEVDVAQQSISDFIEKLSKQVHFSDISIRELPMEQIITKIYQK